MNFKLWMENTLLDILEKTTLARDQAQEVRNSGNIKLIPPFLTTLKELKIMLQANQMHDKVVKAIENAILIIKYKAIADPENALKKVKIYETFLQDFIQKLRERIYVDQQINPS